MFVVRPPASAPRRPLLYKVPLFTYHAYNLVAAEVYDPTSQQGNWCLYNMPQPREVPCRFPESVNVHRPGGGAGGAPYDTFNFDPLDLTPRQTFGHWDARMVRWLEREGYTLDYCTDFDLHAEGRSLLRPYRLLVSAGHDEYWSEAMRSAVEGFTAAGGNAAFFAGNVAWWRITFDSPFSFLRPEQWHEVPGRAENAMTGVSFRNGGERDRADHPQPVGYQVQHADHWVYAGTGLRDGDVFGARPQEYLVGYECDGADFDRGDLEAGRSVVPIGAGRHSRRLRHPRGGGHAVERLGARQRRGHPGRVPSGRHRVHRGDHRLAARADPGQSRGRAGDPQRPGPAGPLSGAALGYPSFCGCSQSSPGTGGSSRFRTR
jgi:hypothetical protein